VKTIEQKSRAKQRAAFERRLLTLIPTPTDQQRLIIAGLAVLSVDASPVRQAYVTSLARRLLGVNLDAPIGK
jgi:hypothetical protein